MRSGAAWGDVYVTMNGGLDMRPNDATGGYRRLHAFNVCEPPANRLRWLIDLKAYTTDDCIPRCLGNPTIARGIVYIGTSMDLSDRGHLLAIADPILLPKQKLLWRCENADVPSANCKDMKYRLVPEPEVLVDVPLMGSMSYTEPALANGKVFVATDASATARGGGFVYMLQSGKEVSRCAP
jgi:hypothetical protein